MKPLRILSAQHVIAARKLLHWTRTDLATRSGLGKEMLRRLETGPPSTRLGQVHLAVEAALEGAGIEFGKDGRPTLTSWLGPGGVRSGRADWFGHRGQASARLENADG